MRTVKTIVLHKDIIKEQQEETLCDGHVEGRWNETTQDYGDMVRGFANLKTSPKSK